MREFTIRNRATRPIMSLTPSVLKKVLAARPESSTLALAKYRQDYKTLSGMAILLDHDQQVQLMARTDANESGMWTSRYSALPSPWREMQSIYTTGFMARTPSDSILDDLAQAEAFFDLLDVPLKAQQP